MAADIIWPIEVLKPASGKSKVVAATISGGRSISGLDQVIQNDAGFWRLTMASIPVRSHEQVRLWNALEATLQGRAGTVLVPMLDCGRQPWPLVGGRKQTSYGVLPFDDGALFDDGSDWYQPVIEADTTDDIAARATTANLRVIYGGEIMAGMHFGVGERAYRIKRVVSSYETAGVVSGEESWSYFGGAYFGAQYFGPSYFGAGGGASGAVYYEVTFWPPAREAIPAGTPVDFDNPRFRARLATDDAMQFDPQLLRFGNPSLEFVEDV